MERNIGYFRTRAQAHVELAAQAQPGVACIHRRFVELYLERAKNEAGSAKRSTGSNPMAGV